MKKSALKYIKIAAIQERPGVNPNSMEPAQYEMLVNAIQKLGFVQPITVRQYGNEYVLIDGHHRFRAAKDAGLPEIPALVADHLSDPQSAAAMLSLNRLRGDTDLGKAAQVLRELNELGFDDMSLTGFAGGDVEALLRGTNSVTSFDDLGPGNPSSAPEVEGENAQSQKRYSLRLVLDRPEDRDAIKALALRHGSTLESGLLALTTTV